MQSEALPGTNSLQQWNDPGAEPATGGVQVMTFDRRWEFLLREEAEAAAVPPRALPLTERSALPARGPHSC